MQDIEPQVWLRNTRGSTTLYTHNGSLHVKSTLPEIYEDFSTSAQMRVIDIEDVGDCSSTLEGFQAHQNTGVPLLPSLHINLLSYSL
jgi:hypothetical protein